MMDKNSKVVILAGSFAAIAWLVFLTMEIYEHRKTLQEMSGKVQL